MRPKGYTLGDYLADCFRCGRTRLASTMRRHWQGFWVCPEHWEERHPQEFVRAVRDDQTVPWAQPPPEAVFIEVCSFNGRSSLPGYAEPGCAIPGRTVIDPEGESLEIPSYCNIFNSQGVPGWGLPGCALPGHDPFAA